MKVYELINHWDGESSGYFSTYEKAERRRDEIIKGYLLDNNFLEAQIKEMIDLHKEDFSIYTHTVE